MYEEIERTKIFSKNQIYKRAHLKEMHTNILPTDCRMKIIRNVQY